MHKTRRQTMYRKSHNKTLSSQKCCITFHDLHHWYKDAFEKLGWIVLSKKCGMHEKAVMYKSMLKRLHEKICLKCEHTYDKDQMNDLEIMRENVECLISHANKDF